MALDPLSVDLVSVISDCSLQLKSHDNDGLVSSKRGEYLKHSTNEGLTLLIDDCNLKEEESLQTLPPFLSSSMDNTAAHYQGEESWDNFHFPNNAATESKTISKILTDDTKCDKGIKTDLDAEMWDEPKADVLPMEIYIKEDVMWCPKSSLEDMLTLEQVEDRPVEEMLTLGQVEDGPVEEMLEAELVNTPSNLLQQTPLFPCVSTMKTEHTCSPLKINQHKCIVKTSSGNPQSYKVKKTVPKANCFVPPSNALHNVASNKSMLLVKCSDTLLTPSRKSNLKNVILNTEQNHYMTPSPSSSYASTAKKTMVKANCPNTVVATSPTKAGPKNQLIDTLAFSVHRNEQTSSVSKRSNSVDNAYLSMPSPMVECSKRNGKVIQCGKQYSLAYTDEETSLSVKRSICKNKMKQNCNILQYNKLMQQLRTAVPSTEHEREASEVVILQEATKYCREIPHIIKEQQKKMHELQSQRKKLREKLSLLHLEIAVKKVRHLLYKGSI